MKIAIIGAGLAGLAAANQLKEYANVKVFESNSIGGLVSSFCNGYCIEKFYHHCFRFDDTLLDTIRRLKLSSKLVWKTVKTGFAVNGKIYSLSTPFEIIRYPHLSLTEKIRLALFTLRSRKRNFEEYDDTAAVDGLRNELGEELFQKFFMPLLRSKFGENAGDVSYAWLLARVAIRSNRKYGGEEIGYLRHGFWQLIDKLCEDIEIVNERAVVKRGSKWEVNGESFDAVVFTAPLPALGDLRKMLGIADVRYQSSVCVLVGAEDSLTADIYWTNVADDMPFGAVIEHTNFMPFEDYGEHLIYLASYSTPNGSLFRMGDDEILKLFLSGLEKLGMRRESIKWARVFRAKYSGPIYERGYARKITPYRVANGFYIAGMTSPPNYPERSMNGSLRAGMDVADVIRRDLL